nr:hypothetical protein [Tanacetum cinerariifolium]
MLELDTHSSSEADISESSPPPIYVAPMVLTFLCSDDLESDTKMPKKHVSPTPPDAMLTRWRSRVASRSSSPTTSTPEIPTAAILPAPSTVFAPSFKALTVRKSVRPLPSHRLALRYTSHHLDHFTSWSSSGHSSSDHLSSRNSILGHSLFRHASLDITVADSSTPPRFIYPPLAMTPRCSEAYASLSTMYPPTTSESSAGNYSFKSSAKPSYKRCRSLGATMTSSINAMRALVPSHAYLLPPCKRFKDSISLKDSVEEDIDADELADIKADATAIEVSKIGMLRLGIDIPDGMLILDAVEHLDQIGEGLQDIYEHVMEIHLQRIEDIKTGQRELEARSLIAGGERAGLLEQVASLERSTARLPGTVMMESARADRFWRCVNFMESELRQIRRFRYYDKMRFRRLETFASNVYDLKQTRKIQKVHCEFIDDVNDPKTRGVISTAEPKTHPTTTTVFDDEYVTNADTLVKMKNQKAKEEGIAFKDANDSARPIKFITTLQPLPTIDPKDKGKGIIQEFEPMKKTKKKDQDQIKRDVEVALKIQAHLNEEAKIERERQEKASNTALAKMYDEVQAHIDADHELAVRLTLEKQEKYTVEERSKLLAEFFERRKKQLAKERAEAIRSKLPTKTRNKRAAGSISKHKSPKNQKVNDQDSEDSDKEHRKCLKVVPDNDKAIDYENLDVKSLIVDCESQVLGTNEAGDVHVYKLTRLDGSYRHFLTFSRTLEVLDRQDVLDLHKIIMKRFPANDLEGYDLILWEDLKTLVESSEDDEIWRNQQDWKLLSWKLYETCGARTLMLDDSSVSINMFVEKRHPLTKEILENMLSLRLEAETKSTLPFDLIKFIKLQIEKK